MPRWPALGIGLREHDVDVGDAGVRDPDLRAREDVRVAVADRPHRHRSDVASCVSLGQAVRPLRLATRHAREVRALELLGAEVGDRQRRQLRDQQHEARRRAHPRQLLGRDRLGHEVRARAAVLDRQTERRQLHRHQGVERVPVISGEMVGLRGPRGDLVLAELAHDLAELALLVGQRDRLHGPSVAPTVELRAGIEPLDGRSPAHPRDAPAAPGSQPAGARRGHPAHAPADRDRRLLLLDDPAAADGCVPRVGVLGQLPARVRGLTPAHLGLRPRRRAGRVRVHRPDADRDAQQPREVPLRRSRHHRRRSSPGAGWSSTRSSRSSWR